jgi:hypothetical protein
MREVKRGATQSRNFLSNPTSSSEPDVHSESGTSLETSKASSEEGLSPLRNHKDVYVEGRRVMPPNEKEGGLGSSTWRGLQY